MNLLNLKKIQQLETHMLHTIVHIFTKYSINYSLYAGSVLGAVRHNGPIPWDSDVDIIISINDLEKVKTILHRELKFPIYLDCYPDNEKNTQLVPRIGCKGVNIDKVHIDLFFYSRIPTDHDDCLSIIEEASKIRKRFYKKCNIHSNNKNSIKRFISNVKRKCNYIFTFRSKDKLFEDFVELCNLYSNTDFSNTIELSCGKYKEKEIFDISFWENTISIKYCDIPVKIPKDYSSFLTQLYGDYKTYPALFEQEKTKSMTVAIDTKIEEWCIDNDIF